MSDGSLGVWMSGKEILEMQGLYMFLRCPLLDGKVDKLHVVEDTLPVSTIKIF